MKTVKHKPTLSPNKCNHCQLMWYGAYFDSHRMIIPEGFVLCFSCWNSLDSFLHKKSYKDWESAYDLHNEEVWNRPLEEFDKEKRREEWNQSHPQFMEMARKWITDPKQKPSPKKRYDRSVPNWMRLAIDLGKVTPGDDYVYAITTYLDHVMKVEKTTDHSILKNRIR